MRILFDSGIFSHSEFAEGAVQNRPVRWGTANIIVPVHGLVRKIPNQNTEYQRQIEALFTVRRLIAEGRLRPFSYIEIEFERFRGKGRIQEFNALRDVIPEKCRPALGRSKFMQTVDFRERISKGGREDRKAGIGPDALTQIKFFEFLCSLDERRVDLLVEHRAELRLDEFEIESLRDLRWFHFLCKEWGSRENYPDAFHLWTAKRNGLDALLTLEKTLPNFVSNLKAERNKRIEIQVDVLRPLELIQKFGISEPDPVPMEPNRFYHLHEVTN